LSAQSDHLLARAPVPGAEGEVVALLSPHAGYEYSGAAAASAFKAVVGASFDVVAVVGSAHYASEAGLFLPSPAAFRTPLGTVPPAEDCVRRLKDSRAASVRDEAHAEEHSLEVQLPFLQKALGRFELLPLVASARTLEDAERHGEALAGALEGKRALLVVSSDLSHYPTVAAVWEVDPASLEAFLSLDPGYLWSSERMIMERAENGLRCAWCGLAAAVAVLSAAKRMGASRACATACANSAEASGDERRTVGYGAALLLRGEAEEGWPLGRLSEEEGRALASLARESLERHLRGEPPRGAALHERPRFNLPAAVFVTWEQGRERLLRGCIGTMEPQGTLADAVRRFAVAAAEQDPRFPGVRADELGSLRAEVSVLSPMRSIRPEEVRPGLGVEVSRGGRGGVFLPQVWEKLPEREEFMGTLCRQKAGLREGAWKEPGTELRAFSVRHFREP